ncbi:MAG: YgjV family protein [Ruminococcaceae bacterium]|nr:YgjV family protein [Oscillospiraceae bacterium]
MKILANVLGLCAVAMFVFSYQLKSRRGIIFFNAASRVLYVLQYILLGAFEGALLDIVAFFVSLLCSKSNSGFIKKHFLLTVIFSNVLVVAVGLTVYENIFSLLPILGVIFETLALWLKKERGIRAVSLLGAPFWLAYNLLNSAYASAAGNVFTLVSITVAIVRYDFLKKEVKKEQK